MRKATTTRRITTGPGTSPIIGSPSKQAAKVCGEHTAPPILLLYHSCLYFFHPSGECRSPLGAQVQLSFHLEQD